MIHHSTSVQRGAVLRVDGLSVSYGRARVLKDVSLELQGGSVHGLVGHNGSGKSTLVKAITGLCHPDPGARLEVLGRQISLPPSADDLRRSRVGVVHQDMGLVAGLSVEDNVLIRSQPRNRVGIVRKKDGRSIVRSVLARLGVEVDPRADIGTLSEATKAVVAFARSLYEMGALAEGQVDVGVLLLDEVTARLGPGSSETIGRAVRGLAREGWGILFIGHRFDEVAALCDVATVLRDGVAVAEVSGQRLTADVLFRTALGSTHEQPRVPRDKASADQAGQRDASRGRSGAVTRFRLAVEQVGEVSCDIDAEPGQIIAVTGLADSGVNSVPYAAVGYSPADRRRIDVDGRRLVGAKSTPQTCLRQGIVIIPGDRLEKGIVSAESVEANINIGAFALLGVGGELRRLKRAENRARAAAHVRKYDVRPGLIDMRASALSGGNQQKVVVARAVEQKPVVLIAHEPTVGVDAAARSDIYSILRDAASGGCTVVVFTEDVDEAWEFGDLVIVMDSGMVVKQYNPKTDSKYDCVSAVLGVR